MSFIFAVIVNIPVIYGCYILQVSCENKSTKVTTTLTTQFMLRTEEGSVLYLYTKFEAELVRGSQNLETGSRDPIHTHLGSFYGPYAGRVSPPSLYQIGSGSLDAFESYKGGPKFPKLGHVTLNHASLEPETLNLCRNSSKHTCCQILCF